METLQQQAVIVHVIREVLIICEYIFDSSPGGFASGIMGLTETGKTDTIPIGHLALFKVMVKQELFFQPGD